MRPSKTINKDLKMDILKYGNEIDRFMHEVLQDMSIEEMQQYQRMLDNKKFLFSFDCIAGIDKVTSYISKTPSKKKAFTQNKNTNEAFSIKIKTLYQLAKAYLIYEAIDSVTIYSNNSYRSFATQSVKYFSDIDFSTIHTFILDKMEEYLSS